MIQVIMICIITYGEMVIVMKNMENLMSNIKAILRLKFTMAIVDLEIQLIPTVSKQFSFEIHGIEGIQLCTLHDFT